MGWLTRWLRTTFDYNPTFPLSALLLLVGLRLLVSDGTLDAGSAAGTAGGLGVLQAYEVALLALALVVLWPRRIAYETTSVLIVFGVLRFAAPFLVIGHAAEGGRGSALLFGVALAGLMALKGHAVTRGIGLDLRGWERAHDALLYGLACVAFPLLAQGLASWTGGALSHGGSRALQIAMCWAFALALAPLALGLPDLGGAGALRSRQPAATLRGLSIVGLPALLWNALWLGGEAPAAFAMLPIGLVATAVLAAIGRACGFELRGAVHVPALAALVVLVAPLDALLGRAHVLSRPQALLLFLPLAGAALALIGRARWRDGLPGLGAVAALAPLSAAGSLRDAEGYALLALLTTAAVGAFKRDGALLSRAALAATLVGVHFAWAWRPLDQAALTVIPLAAGAALAAVTAWRCPLAGAPTAIAAGLCLGPGLVEVVRAPGGLALALLFVAGGGLAALGARRGERLVVALGAALPAVGALRRVSDGVDPGVALVILAFAALPLGTVVALRRERTRATALAAEEDEPAFGELEPVVETAEEARAA
jgi:hypothetical protein